MLDIAGTVLLVLISMFVFWWRNCYRNEHQAPCQGAGDPAGHDPAGHDPAGHDPAGHDPAGHPSTCRSASCVRCTRYDAVTQEARTRLLQYNSERGCVSQRLLTALESQPHPDFQHDLQRPNVLYVPGLPGSGWWDPEAFSPDSKLLESHWQTIREELWTVYYDEESHAGWTANHTDDGSWQTFYLYNQGRRLENNCSRCPLTSHALDRLENFMSGCLFGNALFSVLHPGTTISPHYGPTNVRIRCHLGLDVPEGCRLQVGRKEETWTEGRCLAFDDSFLHSAHHRGAASDQPRVVLMVDLWHPGLSLDERGALLKAFHE